MIPLLVILAMLALVHLPGTVLQFIWILLEEGIFLRLQTENQKTFKFHCPTNYIKILFQG